MLCHWDIVEVEDFPLSVRNASQLADDPSRDTVLTLQAIQDRYVIEVLKRFNGNRSRAAEALGIGRTTLYRILERLGIQDELEAPSRQ
jgi:transcriptional regulator of acetoin/glycerol metabolism